MTQAPKDSVDAELDAYERDIDILMREYKSGKLAKSMYGRGMLVRQKELKAKLRALLVKAKEDSYRKGYNANARDCNCSMLPVAPHHHLMTDGESHNIRPELNTNKGGENV